jgi:putative ABC transport system substrate-binding protein
MEAEAQALGVTLQSYEVRESEELAGAFAAMTKAQALLVVPSYLFDVHAQRIIDFAAQSRLPAMYPDRAFVEDGGLMAYGVNQLNIRRRLAVYVDRILQGAKPGDLPVEQPTQFELVINLKTAKALGLTIPPTLLIQAEELIR